MSRRFKEGTWNAMKASLVLAVAMMAVLVFTNLAFSADSSTYDQSINPGYPLPPVSAGQNVTFTAYWGGENQSVLFCNDSTCSSCWYSRGSSTSELSGCWCYSLPMVTAPFNCTYQTSDSTPRDNVFYMRLYNITQNSSSEGSIHSAGTAESIFYVNHRPYALNVSIIPTPAYNFSNISCNYTFADPDSDTENLTGSVFTWWRLNSTGSYEAIAGQTGKNLTATVSGSEMIKCGVRTMDQYGLTDDIYVNSTPVNITAYTSTTPVLHNVTDDSNSSNPTIVGYDVTFTINWSVETGPVEARAFVCNNSDITVSGCGVGNTNYCASAYESSNIIYCTYTVQDTDPVNNTYFVRLCSNASECSLQVLNGTFVRFNDTTPPTFNLSSINTTGVRPYNMQFLVLDDFQMNMSSVILNVTLNGTSNSSLYNYTDMTCSGTDTQRTCNVSLNLTDGVYNLTFFVRDMNNNANTTRAVLLYDATAGYISTVFNGYNQTNPIIADVSTTKMLFANWTPAEGMTSGVAYYEYALGTAKYPDGGWDSLVTWTNVSINRSATGNYSLLHGTVYYFSVRAMSGSGVASNVTSSSGILYNDVSAPICYGGACIIDDGYWGSNNNTNSKTALHFILNFTEAGSPITSYEYTIGNTTCFVPGYDSVRTVTASASNEVYATGLTLQDNVTYYVCGRAKSANNKWSDWFNTTGITIDSIQPVGGSISYTQNNLSTNMTTVYLSSGYDTISGVGSVELQYAEVLYNPSQGCTGFSGYTTYNASLVPSATSQLVSLSHGYCYKFRYVVRDFAGNAQVYYYGSEISFYVDNTPPLNFSVQINNGDFYTYTSNLTLNWSPASDPESGISYYSYVVKDEYGNVVRDWTNTSQTFIPLSNLAYSNGTPLVHEWKYYAIVVAYNKLGIPFNSTSNQILYIDNAPPSPVVILSVAGDSNATDGYADYVNDGVTNVTVSGEDGIVCVYSLYDIDYSETYGSLCNDTGDNVTCSIASSEGTSTYYITCKDAAGNAQTASQNTAVTFFADWSGPAISSVTPANGAIVTGQITISASIVDTGIGVVGAAWYNISNLSGSIVSSGALSNTAGSTYSATWDSSSYDQTTYNLVIYANDSLGLVSNASSNFTINRDLPYLEVMHEDYSSEPNTQFNISIIAQVFTNVSYNVTNSTGGLVASGDNTTSQSGNRNYLSWPVLLNVTSTVAWPDGEYYLAVRAVNNASNSSTASSSFIIDRDAPAYSGLTNTSAMTVYNNNSLNISVNWTDANNISEVRFETDALNGSLANYTALVIQDGDTFSFFLDEAYLSNNETVLWRFYAMDSAGHWNMTEQDGFTVQNRDPIINSSASLSRNASKNAQYMIDLDDEIFTDYDLDNLSFNASGSYNITILSINQASGVITLNFTYSWTGVENITVNVTDPFGGFNETVIEINVSNSPPVFSGSILPISWLYNTNYTLSLPTYFTDPNGDNLTYNYTGSDNVTAVINQTSGSAVLVPDYGWTGLGWIIFNSTDDEGLNSSSNNVTLYAFTSMDNSTVVNSTVNGVYYSNNESNSISGIADSYISSSNISNSIVVNSSVTNCTILDSTVENAVLSDCYIDPSRIINSSLYEGSVVVDSNVSDSLLVNVSANYSYVFNATVYDTVLLGANVTGDVIYSGLILIWNASYYNATLSGPANLSDIVNYPPVAVIQTAVLDYAGYDSTFTTSSTDRNINSTGESLINDSLSYTWFFGDGYSTNTTSTSASHNYASAGSFTVNLTVTDRYGRSSSTTYGATIQSEYSGGGGGGGGSYQPDSAADDSRTTSLDVSTGLASFYLSTLVNLNNSARFQYGSRYYTITVTGVGPDFASIRIDSSPAQTSRMIEGETNYFDLDGDGSEDISLSLDDVIASTKAYFTLGILKSAPEPPQQVTPPPVEEPAYTPPEQVTPPVEERPTRIELEPEEPTQTSSSKSIVLALLGVLILGSVGVLYYMNREALRKILNKQNPAFAGTGLQVFMAEDDTDQFITQELSLGKTFTDIATSLEDNGWPARQAYSRIAQYVAREGIKEGKSFNMIYDEMLEHGWDQGIVTSILSESLMSDHPPPFKPQEIGKQPEMPARLGPGLGKP
ncbi:PKD domain-containing protein [Candidatus Woesearchaeota archaeon]|nr:PKD domain-containing protein [Candidatus Woesearchaeota archaeon]